MPVLLLRSQVNLLPEENAITKTEKYRALQPPLADGPNETPFQTQNWGVAGQINTGSFTARRTSFASQSEQVVGNLITPNTPGPKPAIVALGPVGTVKEQAVLQYATRLAKLGFATLAGSAGTNLRRCKRSGLQRMTTRARSVTILISSQWMSGGFTV